jgi:hypothetical protein
MYSYAECFTVFYTVDQRCWSLYLKVLVCGVVFLYKILLWLDRLSAIQPWVQSSILRHSGIVVAADKAVFNKILYKNPKLPTLVLYNLCHCVAN